jgi:putative hemolysin
MKNPMKIMSIALMLATVLAGCTAAGGTAEPAAEGAAPTGAAADYCTENGGVVETRYPFYDTNSDNPLQLSGSLGVCTFTAEDGTRMIVGLDTLYSDQPTLAALAYRAQTPVIPAERGVNPSSTYCTQLGGTDAFGGVSAVSGGWGLEGAADTIGLCVFPDLSVIDAWGITYHSDNTIRGADLTDLFRYQP